MPAPICCSDEGLVLDLRVGSLWKGRKGEREPHCVKSSSTVSKEKKKEECRGGRSILGQDSVSGFGFRSRNGSTVRERKEI